MKYIIYLIQNTLSLAAGTSMFFYSFGYEINEFPFWAVLILSAIVICVSIIGLYYTIKLMLLNKKEY